MIKKITFLIFIHIFLLDFLYIKGVESKKDQKPSKSLKEILLHHETDKVKDLVKYINENPNSPDLTKALDYIIFSGVSTLKTYSQIFPFIELRYSKIDKNDPNLTKILDRRVFYPFFRSAFYSKNKEIANKFILKVKKDYFNHPDSKKILELLRPHETSLKNPNIGDEIDLKFSDLEGKKFDSDDHRRKVLLVVFWETKCSHCKKSIPYLLEYYYKYKTRGFDIVGISSDKDLLSLNKYIKENNIPWSQYFDGKGWENHFFKKYGIEGIPAIFLIGKNGKVVASSLTSYNSISSITPIKDKLETEIKKALSN